LVIIDDKLKHFGKFDEKTSNFSQSAVFVYRMITTNAHKTASGEYMSQKISGKLCRRNDTKASILHKDNLE